MTVSQTTPLPRLNNAENLLVWANRLVEELWRRLFEIVEEVNVGRYTRRAISSSPHTASARDCYLGVDCSGSAIEVDLPSAAAAGGGKIMIVKDESGDAGSNNITIDPNGTEQIDEGGAGTPVTISTNFGVMRLMCDGSNWFTW